MQLVPLLGGCNSFHYSGGDAIRPIFRVDATCPISRREMQLVSFFFWGGGGGGEIQLIPKGNAIFGLILGGDTDFDGLFRLSEECEDRRALQVH